MVRLAKFHLTNIAKHAPSFDFFWSRFNLFPSEQQRQSSYDDVQPSQECGLLCEPQLGQKRRLKRVQKCLGAPQQRTVQVSKQCSVLKVVRTMSTVTNFNYVKYFHLLAAPWSTWCFTWTVWASALPTPGWRRATSPSFGHLTFSGPHFHPRQLQLPRLSPPEWPPPTRLPWPIHWLRQPTVRRDSTRGESTLRHHQHFQRIAGTKRHPYNGFHVFLSFIIGQAHKKVKSQNHFCHLQRSRQ